jgi:hypothetical protein
MIVVVGKYSSSDDSGGSLEKNTVERHGRSELEIPTTGGAIGILVLLRLRIVATDGQVRPDSHSSRCDVV